MKNLIFDNNKIEICREILKKEKIGSQYFNNILLMIFALFDLKPVSSFGVKIEDIKKFDDYIKVLGLKYKKFPANSQGYFEIVVSKNIENIRKYISIDKMPPENEIDREKLLGKIFGYTDTAIEAMTKRIKISEPVKFWLDVSKNKDIPDELVIDNMVFDMVPASFDDKESIKLGKEIIKLLNEINPEICKYYLKIGRKTVKQSAEVMMSYFKVK